MFLKSSGSVSWLLVFLGNPGPRYDCTRHNAGFMAGDALGAKLGVRIDRARFHALTAAAEIGGEKVLLMKPQTFMNLSGDAVGEAARFYKIPPERVLVVSDEVSLPLGKLRVRQKGSAGGHNGLKSIIAALSAPRPIPTTTWRTGFCPSFATRISLTCATPQTARPRPSSPTSALARSGP